MKKGLTGINYTSWRRGKKENRERSESMRRILEQEVSD